MKQEESGQQKHKKGARAYFAGWRQIDWGAEMAKALLTSFVFLLLSTGVFWLILQVSPGEYTGQKLETHLLDQISDDVGLNRRTDTIVCTTRLQDGQAAADRDRLVYCGSYTKGGTPSPNGRFVYVFERQEPTFWNKLIGAKAAYVPVLSRSIEANYLYNSLEFDACTYEDINADGTPEILIQHHSNFADRRSRGQMVLQQIDGTWELLVPDLSGVCPEVEAQAGEESTVMLDTFVFCDPRAPRTMGQTVYSFSYHGSIRRIPNPLWGGYDHLYTIAVNDGYTGFMFTDKTAYVMLRCTDHGLLRDPNWNNGEALYVSETDYDEQTLIESLWGISTDGFVFYQNDVP